MCDEPFFCIMLQKQLAAVASSGSKPLTASTVVPRKAASKESSPQPVAVDVAQLEKDIAAQGDVVRQLKSSKAEKKVVDEAVSKLLVLKKQLTAATGEEQQPAAVGAQGSKKKGGNKKKH